MQIGTIISLLVVGIMIGVIAGMWFWDTYMKGTNMCKEKIVIFKSAGKYKFCTKKVYDASIMNLNEVCTIVDCSNAKEAIDTVVRWGIVEPTDIIDMTGE